MRKRSYDNLSKNFSDEVQSSSNTNNKTNANEMNLYNVPRNIEERSATRTALVNFSKIKNKFCEINKVGLFKAG